MSAQPKWCGPFQYGQETCPACGSADVSFGGTSTTLVGWMSGRPEDNPNHHTQGCDCRACGLHYTREWVIRDRNAWAAIGVDEGEVIYGSKAYTKYVIAGYPSCCESSYLIHCRRCWRVGVSIPVGPNEECPECGKVNTVTLWDRLLED